MNQQIHCIVNDCHYWNQGNMCHANEILVSTDEFSNKQSGQVDTTTAKQLTPTSAGNYMATCCKTYSTKDSNQAKSDSVKKMR